MKLIEKTNSLSEEDLILLANEYKLCLKERKTAILRNKLLVESGVYFEKIHNFYWLCSLSD